MKDFATGPLAPKEITFDMQGQNRDVALHLQGRVVPQIADFAEDLLALRIVGHSAGRRAGQDKARRFETHPVRLGHVTIRRERFRLQPGKALEQWREALQPIPPRHLRYDGAKEQSEAPGWVAGVSSSSPMWHRQMAGTPSSSARKARTPAGRGSCTMRMSLGPM